MNAITGLNHLTLAVSDLERSVAFYAGLLGFSIRMHGPSSAYLEAGTLWLALVVDPDVRRGPLPEYSHVAFSVGSAELGLLTGKLISAGATRWQEADNASSFYFLDPDGHKLELHTGDLKGRLAADTALSQPGASAVVRPEMEARRPNPIEQLTIAGRLLLLVTVLLFGAGFYITFFFVAGNFPPGQYPLVALLIPTCLVCFIFFLFTAWLLEKWGIQISAKGTSK